MDSISACQAEDRGSIPWRGVVIGLGTSFLMISNLVLLSFRYPVFQDSREYKLVKRLVDHMEESDVGNQTPNIIFLSTRSNEKKSAGSYYSIYFIFIKFKIEKKTITSNYRYMLYIKSHLKYYLIELSCKCIIRLICSNNW